MYRFMLYISLICFAVACIMPAVLMQPMLTYHPPQLKAAATHLQADEVLLANEFRAENDKNYQKIYLPGNTPNSGVGSTSYVHTRRKNMNYRINNQGYLEAVDTGQRNGHYRLQNGVLVPDR